MVILFAEVLKFIVNNLKYNLIQFLLRCDLSMNLSKTYKKKHKISL
jgi:hypothetical protein